MFEWKYIFYKSKKNKKFKKLSCFAPTVIITFSVCLGLAKDHSITILLFWFEEDGV